MRDVLRDVPAHLRGLPGVFRRENARRRKVGGVEFPPVSLRQVGATPLYAPSSRPLATRLPVRPGGCWQDSQTPRRGPLRPERAAASTIDTPRFRWKIRGKEC